MRRWAALLAAAAVLISCVGCAAIERQETGGTPVSFYYLHRESEQTQSLDAVISAEQRNVNVVSMWDFLDIYLKGPASENLVSPFPSGTRILDVQDLGGTLSLTMSGEFFALVGIEMSLAGCCLSNTVCDYTGRESVVIRDETESIRMEFAPSQYVLSNDLKEDETATYTVYFSDRAHRYLISETRDATLSSNETEAAYVLRQLLDGPESEQLEPIMPAGTQLLGVQVSDGLCTVNFSHDFLSNKSADTGKNYLTVYGVVNTLTSLPDIEEVRFQVDGSWIEQYGIFPLTAPLMRNAECIGPIRTASGEVDVNLYALRLDDQTPFAEPCRVKQTISEPLAEAVMKKCLTFEPAAGFYNPIPYGTELMDISVSGSVCYVDLSARFVPQEDTEEAEKAAVWALVMSLTDLEGITTVALTIGGESGGLNYVDISEPFQRESVAAFIPTPAGQTRS